MVNEKVAWELQCQFFQVWVALSLKEQVCSMELLLDLGLQQELGSPLSHVVPFISFA